MRTRGNELVKVSSEEVRPAAVRGTTFTDPHSKRIKSSCHMSSANGVDLHIRWTAVELPHIHMIHVMKDERR